MAKFDGLWAVLDLRSQSYLESFKSKSEGMDRVNKLNDQEEAHGRYKKYAVVPLTTERFHELKQKENAS